MATCLSESSAAVVFLSRWHDRQPSAPGVEAERVPGSGSAALSRPRRISGILWSLLNTQSGCKVAALYAPSPTDERGCTE